jgi:hypothetical protein
MASTYTLNTGIELIANGEQSGTWGTTTNVNLEIIDRLTNGVGAITLSGTTHTLTTTDGTLSDGQFKVLVFGGSPSGTNTVTISPNDQDKQYFILNSSGQSVVLTQGSGGNVTIANGKSAIVFADGGGAGAAVTDLTATFVPAGALLAANNLSDVANAGTSRTNLGVAIGTDVLAFDTNLQAFVTAFTLPTTDGTVGQALVTDGSGTVSFGECRHWIWEGHRCGLYFRMITEETRRKMSASAKQRGVFRVCPDCGEDKRDMFYLNARGNKTNARCRECHKLYCNVNWHAKTPIEKQASRVRTMYGMDPQDYIAMHEQQAGKCAVCQNEPTTQRGLHLDHCHETGAIRGLLCHNCNVALGCFNDSPALMMRAIKYLGG